MVCTSVSAENSRDWLKLPWELTASILVRLGAVEVLVSARKVCKTWRQICSEPYMWRVVDTKNAYDSIGFFKVDEVTRKAVDLSCGQLIEFSIDYFATDELLLYVADRSSQLKRLCLDIDIKACITEGGLCEMLRKFPLLEELHLDHVSVSKQLIEVAGQCCPRLKSFKLIVNTRYGYPYDDHALAIAGNMPGLHHLQLYGNKITNDGLLAVLEKCPLLKSLDIWVNDAGLEPYLVLRLCQQIKDVTVSYYSSKDGEFDN